MRQLYLILFLLCITKCISQNIFKAQIVSENPSGINIINISNYQTSISNGDGIFTIKAKPSDTLQITSNKINGLQIILKAYHFSTQIFKFYTTPKIQELEEVIIKKDYSINAFSLGIIPEKLVTYSPAERRLKAKTKIDSRVGFNDSFNESLLLNAVSSKNSNEINNLLLERKEHLLEKLSATFTDDFYVNNLKIPEIHIKGFQYYIIENPKFVQHFNSKNTIMTKFLLHDLAIKYNHLLKNE